MAIGLYIGSNYEMQSTVKLDGSEVLEKILKSFLDGSLGYQKEIVRKFLKNAIPVSHLDEVVCPMKEIKLNLAAFAWRGPVQRRFIGQGTLSCFILV